MATPVQTERSMPHDIEVEKSILGAVLLDNHALTAAAQVLSSDDFFAEANRFIYEAMTALFERGEAIDTVTLRAQLDKQEALQRAGGPAYISSLIDGMPSTSNVEQYARIVKDKAALRRLISASNDIVKEAMSGAVETDELLDRAEHAIFEISESKIRRGFVRIQDVAFDTMKEIEELMERGDYVTGVPTGFSRLDAMTAGFQAGDLIILAARPSMGKCLAADSEIVLNDGSLVTIEELVQRRAGTIPTLRDDFKLDWAQPSDFIDDGIKPTFEVVTRLGRRVTTTLTHPFLTIDGWRPLGQLEPGDEVAVPARLAVEGSETITEPAVRDLAERILDSDGGAQWEPSGQGGGRGAVASRLEPGLARRLATLTRASLQAVLERVWAAAETTEAEGGSIGRQLQLGCETAALVQHLLLRLGLVASLERSTGTLRIGPDSQRQSDVLWDEIVSIEYVGDQQVYDLTVPGTHNFVANDVCVHNTALSLNIAQHVALENKGSVGFFSLEMSVQQVVRRLVTGTAMVDAHKLATGFLSHKDKEKLLDALHRLSETKIFIDDTAAMTVLEMRAKARRLKAEHGLDLLVIDYLQLVRGGGRSENRNLEIGEISRSTKALAKELQVPIIALSQLSRAPETRSGHRPQLSDLRECVTGDTLVQLADGSRASIQSLVGKTPEVVAMTPDGFMTAARSDKVWEVGERDVFEVRLATGRMIRATARHRFFSNLEWRRLADMAPGDRVAIPRQVSQHARPAEWPDLRVALLGQLIGDGSYLKGQPMRYTTCSERNSAIVRAAAAREFGATVRRYRGRRTWHQLLISGNGNRWHPAGVNRWLRELGVFDQRSHEKRVPEAAFRLGSRQIAILLRHLWATDGCIAVKDRGGHAVHYATTSRGLADDVAALLQRLGIVARIYEARKADHRPSFMVAVQGALPQRIFLDMVGAFGPKKAAAARLSDALVDVEPNTNVDTLPVEAFNHVKFAMAARGITHRQMASVRGTSYGGTSHFRFAPSRDLFGDYADRIGEERLRRHSDNDLFWDRVVSIEPAGRETVYDLTVPGPASWVGNSIISHNSGNLEQDADVVSFIFRPEVYSDDPELEGVAELIIAKQRNGPIGTVPLAFLKPYTLFKDRAETDEAWS